MWFPSPYQTKKEKGKVAWSQTVDFGKHPTPIFGTNSSKRHLIHESMARDATIILTRPRKWWNEGHMNGQNGLLPVFKKGGRKMYKNGSWRDLPRKELISPTHFCKAPKSITTSGISFIWSSLVLSTLQLLGWSGPEIIKEMFVLRGLIQLIFKWFAGCPTQVPESSREFYSREGGN